MTRKEHIERHKMLHAMVDELFADYLVHNLPAAMADELFADYLVHNLPPAATRMEGFWPVTVERLMAWSHKQTTDPDELPND